jgi:6-pyruvoyltetrahydropterin/6-carboxytetrahydropterin synthase
MNTIRISKIFQFEMAHALFGYDGPCKNIHGHSYELIVTVKGKTIVDKENPKEGMVMDFTDLKKIVKPIVDELDHATVLNEHTPQKQAAIDNLLFQKLVLVEYQPTCENMLVDIAKRISKNLPSEIKLHHLKLKETPTSYAEWFAEDNDLT